MNRLFAFALAAVFSAPLFAQPAPEPGAPGGLPPGKWWRRPQAVEKLQLTKEQQNRLDEVFNKSAAELIDLKADAQKKMLALRTILDKGDLDRAEVQRAAADVNTARGRLFERELMMLVDMRGVLTPKQWDQVRSAVGPGGRDRGDRQPRGMRPDGNQPRQPGMQPGMQPGGRRGGGRH